jgi:hypothetical protein
VTWDKKFYAAQNGTHGFSLADIRFSNSTSLWAGGSVVGPSSTGDGAQVPYAWFLRSDDGGNTWYQGNAFLPGLVVMALDSPSDSVSYAASLSTWLIVLSGLTSRS